MTEELREVTAIIHRISAEWSAPGDNDCGHGSEPSQCEETAAAIIAALAAPSVAAEGLREAIEAVLRGRARGGQGWGFNADMHEEEVVEAILSDPAVLAALASEPARPSLDTARLALVLRALWPNDSWIDAETIASEYDHA